MLSRHTAVSAPQVKQLPRNRSVEPGAGRAATLEGAAVSKRLSGAAVSKRQLESRARLVALRLRRSGTRKAPLPLRILKAQRRAGLRKAVYLSSAAASPASSFFSLPSPFFSLLSSFLSLLSSFFFPLPSSFFSLLSSFFLLLSPFFLPLSSFFLLLSPFAAQLRSVSATAIHP